MSNMDQTELAKLAETAVAKFLPTILEEEYGLVGMTRNLAEFLLGRVQSLFVFYNYEKGYTRTVGAFETRTEIQGGGYTIDFHAATSEVVPPKKTPFAWACRINGQWYLHEAGGPVEKVEKNFWVTIVEQWVVPGYVQLHQYQQGLWSIVDSDPTKPSS